MSLAPLTDAQRMQMASDIADAASSLDWLKNNTRLSKSERAAIVEEVRSLHEHAATLADSRVAEIFAPDDAPVQQDFLSQVLNEGDGAYRP